MTAARGTGGATGAAGWAGWAVLAALAALLVVNVVHLARHPGELRPPGRGDVAPPIRLPALDGSGLRTLAERHGQVVLVDFWASWCEPCRESMPALEALYRRRAPEGFTVLSVNVEGMEQAPRARAFAAAMRPPLTFPVVVDDGTTMDAYRVDAIPHLVLIDKRGVIRHVHVGGFGRGTAARLDEKIAALLAER